MRKAEKPIELDAGSGFWWARDASNPCKVYPRFQPSSRFKPTLSPYTIQVVTTLYLRKAMPADDYTAAVSGGLKLKGVNSTSKVSKPRKKKRPKAPESESTTNVRSEESKDEPIKDGEDTTTEQDESTIDGSERKLENVEATAPPQVGKTEAELRHEERRRKRVCSSLLVALIKVSKTGFY